MGTAQDALNVFRSWVAQGIRENPPGSNRTPIGVEFGWNGVAWCAEAVSVALKRTGTPGLWSASCYELIDMLRRQGRWQGANRPQVGALAFYSSGAFPNGGAHVTIVESVSGGRMVCLGGNESDSVKRSIRSVGSSYGFGMPAYTAGPSPTPTPQKGFLMALTDAQQGDVYNWLNELRNKAVFGGTTHPNYGDLVNEVTAAVNAHTDAKIAEAIAALKT